MKRFLSYSLSSTSFILFELMMIILDSLLKKSEVEIPTSPHIRLNRTPDRIRTCGPQIRNLMLYPSELPGHFIFSKSYDKINGINYKRKYPRTKNPLYIRICFLTHDSHSSLVSNTPTSLQ